MLRPLGYGAGAFRGGFDPSLNSRGAFGNILPLPLQNSYDFQQENLGGVVSHGPRRLY